jgi:hypothetical protein
MGYYKELAMEQEWLKEQELKQEQNEEEAYQQQLMEEEFNFERDQGAKIP